MANIKIDNKLSGEISMRKGLKQLPILNCSQSFQDGCSSSNMLKKVLLYGRDLWRPEEINRYKGLKN